MKTVAIITLAACAAPPSSPAIPDAPDKSDAALAQQDAVGSGSASGSARLRAVFEDGQSNAVGMAQAPELTGDLAALAEPYPAVREIVLYGDDFVSPQGQKVYDGPLAPLCAGSSAGSSSGAITQLVAGSGAGCYFGNELSLGRALDAAYPGQVVIIKYATSSTYLYGQWWPWGSYYPHGVANGGSNQFNESRAFLAHELTAAGATYWAHVWEQGEEDARTVSGGSGYGGELAALVADDRYVMQNTYGVPPVPVIVGQLNAAAELYSAATKTWAPEPGLAGVRQGEQDVAAQGQDVELVDQDAYPLRADRIHYTGPAYVAIGSAFAAAILQVAP